MLRPHIPLEQACALDQLQQKMELNLISRDDFVRSARSVVGDDLLMRAIKQMREKSMLQQQQLMLQRQAAAAAGTQRPDAPLVATGTSAARGMPVVRQQLVAPPPPQQHQLAFPRSAMPASQSGPLAHQKLAAPKLEPMELDLAPLAPPPMRLLAPPALASSPMPPKVAAEQAAKLLAERQRAELEELRRQRKRELNKRRREEVHHQRREGFDKQELVSGPAQRSVALRAGQLSPEEADEDDEEDYDSDNEEGNSEEARLLEEELSEALGRDEAAQQRAMASDGDSGDSDDLEDVPLAGRTSDSNTSSARKQLQLQQARPLPPKKGKLFMPAAGSAAGRGGGTSLPPAAVATTARASPGAATPSRLVPGAKPIAGSAPASAATVRAAPLVISAVVERLWLAQTYELRGDRSLTRGLLWWAWHGRAVQASGSGFGRGQAALAGRPAAAPAGSLGGASTFRAAMPAHASQQASDGPAVAQVTMAAALPPKSILPPVAAAVAKSSAAPAIAAPPWQAPARPGGLPAAAGSAADAERGRSTLEPAWPGEAAATPSKRAKPGSQEAEQSIDQLNDVTAVSGVNLREEEEQLLQVPKEASHITEAVRKLVREEESMLFLDRVALQTKLTNIALRHGLKAINPEVHRCISMAAEERLRAMLYTLVKLSKQRKDNHKSKHKIVYTLNTPQQLQKIRQREKELLDRREALEQEQLRLLNEKGGKDKASITDAEKEELRLKALKAKELQDEQMKATAANRAAREAIGVDERVLQWQMALNKKKLDRAAAGSSSGSAAGMSAPLAGQGARERLPPDSPAATGRPGSAGRGGSSETDESREGAPQGVEGTSSATQRTSGGSQSTIQGSTGRPPGMSLGRRLGLRRTISVADVIFLLQREQQMCKSKLLYRLCARDHSTAAGPSSALGPEGDKRGRTAIMRVFTVSNGAATLVAAKPASMLALCKGSREDACGNLGDNCLVPLLRREYIATGLVQAKAQAAIRHRPQQCRHDAAVQRRGALLLHQVNCMLQLQHGPQQENLSKTARP
eukprot:SM000016S01854  [mRNA]  locus=s16:213205:220004:- [translate_table: standard]